MSLSARDRVRLRKLAEMLLHPFIYINYILIPDNANDLEEGVKGLEEMRGAISEVLEFYEKIQKEG